MPPNGGPGAVCLARSHKDELLVHPGVAQSTDCLWHLGFTWGSAEVGRGTLSGCSGPPPCHGASRWHFPRGPQGLPKGGPSPFGEGCSMGVVVGAHAGCPERGSLRGTGPKGVGYPIGPFAEVQFLVMLLDRPGAQCLM